MYLANMLVIASNITKEVCITILFHKNLKKLKYISQK